VLRAAHEMGYVDYPRVSATEVADAIGIDQSTLAETAAAQSKPLEAIVDHAG